MKRPQKSFSVEIKKSRIPDQRPHLPPRPLFAMAPDETPALIQKTEPEASVEPLVAPRILPSIVETMWRRLEPAELVHRESSSGETKHGQVEFDLNAASEGVIGVPAATPVQAEAALPTDTTASVKTDAPPTHDAQPASGRSAKSHARKVRKKAPAAVERGHSEAPEPKAEPKLYAGMIKLPTSVRSPSSQRRRTKRLTAAGQLPRSERWKRRLHPASWREQRSKPV
jgi:hypothetical protein